MSFLCDFFPTKRGLTESEQFQMISGNMPLVIIQAVLNAVLAYLAFHVTFHQSSKMKIIIFKILIISCCLAGVVLSVLQYHNSEINEESLQIDFNGRIDALRTNNAAEKTELSDKIGVVSSNLTAINTLREQYAALSRQYENQMAYMVTNQSFNAEARKALIESDVKFQDLNLKIDDWNDRISRLKGEINSRQELRQIEVEKAVKAEQAAYDLSVPLYDYTARILTNMLVKMALMSGDTAIPEFHGMQFVITPGLGETNLAEIKFQKNTNWDFQVVVTSSRFLRVKSKDDFLDIGTMASGATELNTYLHLFSDTECLVKSGPAQDYKPTIDDALGYLIAAQADKYPLTNYSASKMNKSDTNIVDKP